MAKAEIKLGKNDYITKKLKMVTKIQACAAGHTAITFDELTNVIAVIDESQGYPGYWAAAMKAGNDFKVRDAQANGYVTVTAMDGNTVTINCWTAQTVTLTAVGVEA